MDLDVPAEPMPRSRPARSSTRRATTAANVSPSVSPGLANPALEPKDHGIIIRVSGDIEWLLRLETRLQAALAQGTLDHRVAKRTQRR
jgi:hypothetical protein